MEVSRAIVPFALVCVVLLANTCSAMEAEIHHCRGIEIKITAEQKGHMEACLTEAGAKEIKSVEMAKLACFAVCLFKKNNIFDDKGKPIRDIMVKLITEQMPEVVHKELTKRTDECLKEENTKMIDAADETCTSYLPMLMCLHLSMLEECAD